jgi:hypothetical protein
LRMRSADIWNWRARSDLQSQGLRLPSSGRTEA